MVRRFFVMRLKRGGLTEYRQHHDHIWPELVVEMQQSGIVSISVFEADPLLYCIVELETAEGWETFLQLPAYLRWAAVMEPFMEFDGSPKDAADGSDIARDELAEVFHVKPEQFLASNN